MSHSRKEVLPVKGERNVLVTSALPYVNNVPHLGNIIGAILSADVYARYCRQRGYNTLFVCGTDEYGTATETKALEEGVSCEEICAKYHQLHKEIYEWFDVKFDIFGRTSTPQQTKIAQDIFHTLHKNKWLIEDTQEQLFDPVYKRFLSDRFVYGFCPKCNYKDARGDQCDLCGSLLNPLELIDPKSKLSNQTPEKRNSDHLLIDLPKLQPQLEEWVNKCMESGNWTEIAKSITKAWVKEGLQPRCITRDLKWGTPVPLEKYKDKVFYVWFDAPIGYISITACYTDQWEKWWKNPDDVRLVQFMGKDNVPFHSVIFPCSLLGTGEKWTLVNDLSSTEYLNYESGKFSKSRGVGVFGDHAKQLGVLPEVWRYYLMSNRPEAADSVFLWDDFAAKNNNELLANLGNFTNRILKFVQTSYNGTVPKQGELIQKEKDLIHNINVELAAYIKFMESAKLKEGLKAAMAISRLGNHYMQECKPWELIKSDQDRCSTVVNVAVQVIFCLVSILEPFIPGYSRRVLEQLSWKVDGETRINDTIVLDIIPAGHKIGNPQPLFQTLSNDHVKNWQKKFAGKEKFALELKVGEVEQVEDLAESKYKLIVNLGTSKKQIVAGIKQYYPTADSLKNKKVIVACNLKHAKRSGVKSEGMLLTAKKQDGEIVLLAPQDPSVALGSSCIPDGLELDINQVLAAKTLETVLKGLSTNDDSSVHFKGAILHAGGSLLVAEKPVGKGQQVC